VNRLYSLFRGSIPAVDADLPEPLVRAAEPWPITGSAVRRTCSAWHSAEGQKHNREITKMHEKEMRDGTRMGMGEGL